MTVTEKFVIRRTRSDEMPIVLAIYEHGREIMRREGNPTQWGATRPSRAVIERDIANGNSYAVTVDGRVCAVFSFIIGDDPTYAYIENGEWSSDGEYGVIHRIASDESEHGVLAAAVEFCSARIGCLRIDTHRDNAIMRRLLAKLGFEEYGVIYTDDGTPRLAFERYAR